MKIYSIKLRVDREVKIEVKTPQTRVNVEIPPEMLTTMFKHSLLFCSSIPSIYRSEINVKPDNDMVLLFKLGDKTLKDAIEHILSLKLDSGVHVFMERQNTLRNAGVMAENILRELEENFREHGEAERMLYSSTASHAPTVVVMLRRDKDGYSVVFNAPFIIVYWSIPERVIKRYLRFVILPSNIKVITKALRSLLLRKGKRKRILQNTYQSPTQVYSSELGIDIDIIGLDINSKKVRIKFYEPIRREVEITGEQAEKIIEKYVEYVEAIAKKYRVKKVTNELLSMVREFMSQNMEKTAEPAKWEVSKIWFTYDNTASSTSDGVSYPSDSTISRGDYTWEA